MTYKNVKKWSAERRGDAFIAPETSTSLENPELLHNILADDCREILPSLPEHSIDLSLWSPPYYVGKSYEEGWSFDDWQELLEDVITLHSAIIKPVDSLWSSTLAISSVLPTPTCQDFRPIM